MPSMIGKIEPGDVIGRCRIIRELGRGGVGTVYLATHQTLQIEVALKILSPTLSLDNPALAERFIREAQLAARIRHPNVIAVMDAAHDEATGLYFIVLEYVGGGALSWHLRNGPLPETKALAIITGIAHALGLAEENRIVHRDIKPDNIMLDLKGTAKLADLGLAKHAFDSRISLTLGGSYMGTPAYMSPEQARDAKAADTRDDIYSLGATFYECLTGEPPFQGETPYNIMSELLTKPSPRPSALRPDLSDSADLICRKMMAKTRDLRYADALALLHDLHICQTCGDSGLDRLEAASFDEEAMRIRREALSYGVETSADGVALIPDLPDDSEPGPLTKKASGLIAPRRADYGVFGAAMLLLLLVTVATLFLAWTGPNHPLTFIRHELAMLLAETAAVSAPEPIKNQGAENSASPGKTASIPQQAEKPPIDAPPQVPAEEIVKTVPRAQPVTPPQPVPPPFANPTNASSAAPPLPLSTPGPEVSTQPVPAVPAMPDSAFTARAVAESSLGMDSTNTTGQVDLLKIIGKHDSAQTMPTTWTFYFYDRKTISNARIVSVCDHQVAKNGVDIWHPLAPFGQEDVLPEEKLLTDSNDALKIAEALIPDVNVSGSSFVLMQKNGVPTWMVTLWARNRDGEEQELGTVSVLAEGGAVSSTTLKPGRVSSH